MDLEYIAIIAISVISGLAGGYFFSKSRLKLPRHKILVDKGAYDYLRERDEILTQVEQDEQEKPVRSPVMYIVKDYVWNN